MNLTNTIQQLVNNHFDWVVANFYKLEVTKSPFGVDLDQSLYNCNVQFVYDDMIGYYVIDHQGRTIRGVYPATPDELWWFLMNLADLCCNPCTYEFAKTWIRLIGAEIGYDTFSVDQWAAVCDKYEAALVDFGIVQ